MSKSLPRVTYSNPDVDLDPIHAEFDARLPGFEQESLGRTFGAIIGDNLEAGGEGMFDIMSPIDRSLKIGSCQISTQGEIDRAITAATKAGSGWSSRSAESRIAMIRAFAESLASIRFELAQASLFEVGKSRVEAIGEAEEAVDLPNYYASELEKHHGYVQALEQAVQRETTESRLMPFGVFAVISPFNFPLALSLNMISAALIMGNTVVFKPSLDCSLSGRMIVEAALEAGIPPGVLNLVIGSGEVGENLVSHPGVQGVAFTGSHDVGMSIARAMMKGETARPIIAEMGGKNPAYVTRNADLKVAAEGVARSAFGLQGQKCSACSVVYVDKDVQREFLDALVQVTSSLSLGDPRLAGTFMGAVQTEATVARFEEAVAYTEKNGSVAFGGRRATAGELGKGLFLEPTIVAMPEPSYLTREELFMPFVAVRGIDDLRSAMNEGNAVKYGLSAGIYTEDQQELQYFLDNVQAGVVYANRRSGATTGAWPGMQSFCGWKGSGVTHKGGLGPYFPQLFAREQSRTIYT